MLRLVREVNGKIIAMCVNLKISIQEGLVVAVWYSLSIKIQPIIHYHFFIIIIYKNEFLC